MSATGEGCAVLYLALVAMEMSHNYYPCLERKKLLKSILGLKILITIKILTTIHRGSAMWSNPSLLEKGGEGRSFLVRQECRGAGDKVGQTTTFCKVSWFLYHQLSVLSLSSTWTEALAFTSFPIMEYLSHLASVTASNHCEKLSSSQ